MIALWLYGRGGSGYLPSTNVLGNTRHGGAVLADVPRSGNQPQDQTKDRRATEGASTVRMRRGRVVHTLPR